MRPHEETWDSAEDFEVTILGPELDRGIDGPREVLARAAPEMARALVPVAERRCESLTTLERECPRLWEDPAEWCPTCCARKALAKAGVPLQ